MKSFLTILGLAILACNNPSSESSFKAQVSGPHLLVLGIAQDAGYPQAGCEKNCCLPYWEGKNAQQYATSLALIDPKNKSWWLFEATPDIKFQLELVRKYDPALELKGVFLTHAHIGHYAGLIHFGKEVIGADQIPVYAMPRMQLFLENNGPWSQLVSQKNITIHSLVADSTIELGTTFKVEPFLVPHRDEYSETVGFEISGSEKSALLIPDIDKWNKWDTDIGNKISEVDYALLDGTFFGNGELPNRDMSEIPHPFIEESLDQFATLDPTTKSRIHFIHLNHTNPALFESSASKRIEEAGMKLAKQLQTFAL